MNLPENLQWLNNEPGPASLKAALKYYGLHEIEGSKSDQTIMGFAKTLGITWYNNDDTPWCGLAEGISQYEAGFPFDKNLLLAALNWEKWGTPIPIDEAMLGDTVILKRTGGGHVTKYIAENKAGDKYYCYGGNQGNEWTFEWILKSRVYAVRRAKWKISQPANIRKIIIDDHGAILGGNEA